MFVPVDDGPECRGQVGVEFAGLDQGRDGGPVCGTGILAREEGVFAVQSDGSDGALDGVGVDPDPSVGEE